jgi:molybdopterin converting factor small subunit
VKVTVKLGAPLSQVVGESKAILSMPEKATVADALAELGTRYPDFEAALKGKGLRLPPDKVIYTLFVNERIVPLEQATAIPLRDGDRIYLFLPVVGG